MGALERVARGKGRLLGPRFQRLGLQRRIMLYVSAGLVVFSAIYAWVALQAIQQSSDLVVRERLLAARAIAREADSTLGSLQTELQDAGKQVAPNLARSDSPSAYSALDHLYDHWTSDHHFDAACSLTLADSRGAVLWSRPVNQLPAQDGSAMLSRERASRSSFPFVTEAPAPGPSGEMLLTMALPLTAETAARSAVPFSFVGPALAANQDQRPSSTDDNPAPANRDAKPPAQFLGSMTAVIDRAHLAAALERDLQVADPDYAVELIDETGRVFASNQKARELARSDHGELVAELLRSRQTGVRTHTSLENGSSINHVVAFAPLSLMPWGVMVEQEEDQAFLLPRKLQIQFVGFGLLALVAGLGLAWLTTGRVVGPVNALIVASSEIASGNLDRALDISGADEVGTLARSFDHMRSELRHSREEIAGWNRDLEERVSRRTRELSALVASSHALTSTLELDELFDILMGATNEMLPAAQAIALFMVEPETGGLVVRSTFGLQASACTNVHLDPGEGLGGKVFQSQTPISLRTAEGAKEDHASLSAANREHLQLAMGNREITSAVGVPLLSRGSGLGALVLYNFTRSEAFADSDVAVLQALADQAAAAIENARLYREASEAGALRELNRLKSEFVVRASHELRTPLTAVKSLTETLLRPDLQLDAGTRQEFLEGIDSASDRLNDIVKQLLMLSRVEAGRLDIRRETVNVAPIIQRVVERFQVQTPSRAINVSTLDETLPVRGDAERIDDVLSNLISNALKYSSPGAPVIIRAGVVEDRVLVSVQDEGIGIPPEARERIFERFYRIDNRVTRSIGGAGLGLHLSKTYVEAMGGAIHVESEHEKGSVFSFVLPRLKESGTDRLEEQKAPSGN